MPLADDLLIQTKAIFGDQWSYRDGRIVPKTEDVGEKNDGVRLDATVLYADLSDSTKLVDTHEPWRAAGIYKAFLRCAVRIIKAEGGEIRSYDGDRVMGVFLGNAQNTSAARAALKINFAVKFIVQPAYDAANPFVPISINHCVGIDTSPVMAIRAGVRGSNDIAWIGKAANHAAKMTALPHEHSSYITSAVFDQLHDNSKFSEANGTLMWEKVLWPAMNNAEIYRSTWWWRV